MRTEIMLEEFLFVMNQDEDIRVTLIDYEIDSRIITAWKSDLLYNEKYTKHKDWKVQDFSLAQGGLEIVITQFEPED